MSTQKSKSSIKIHTFVAFYKNGVKKLSTLNNILKLLDEQGKQQKELADFLGLNKNNISDWKAGRSKSYTKYLYQIADFLKTTPEYLRGETDVKEKFPDESKGKRPVTEESDNLDKDIINEFSLLSDEQKKEVLNYISYLSQRKEKNE